MAFSRWKKYINDGYSSSQNVFGHSTSSFEIVFLTANQVFMMTFSHRKNTLTMALVRRKIYLVIQLLRKDLSSSQNVFGHPTSSYVEVFLTDII